MEHEKGKGAIKSRIDLRDHKWSKLGMASMPFDWVNGYKPNDNSKTKDQGTSSSCGGQAAAYLAERLWGSEFSAKSVYSLVYVNGGGSSLRDILSTICKRGVNFETTVPSQPALETNFEDKSWVSLDKDTEASVFKGQKYAFINIDIEGIAQAVRDNGNAIILIEGQNNGTWLSPTPIPPNNNNAIWRHFLFVSGAEMVNGKKALKCHNSWGPNTGLEGFQWINEDFFTNNRVVESGTVYKPNPDLIPITQRSALILTIQKLINNIYRAIDLLK